MEITQFMNAISQLVFEACDIIKSVHESECLGVKMKSEANPVTIADVTIQLMIVNSLAKLWPSIQIIGEENVDAHNALSPIGEKPIDDHVDFFRQYFQSSVLELEDFCVWIDPLDGTLSFLNGNL